MSRKGYIFNKKIACDTCAGGRMARSEPLYRAAIWLMAIAAPLSIPVLIQDNLPLWATGGLEIIFMIAIAVFFVAFFILVFYDTLLQKKRYKCKSCLHEETVMKDLTLWQRSYRAFLFLIPFFFLVMIIGLLLTV